MGVAHRRAALWLAAAICIGGRAASAGEEDSALAFSMLGGDAWTFEKRIEVTVAEGACDEVALASPAATLIERPASGGVSARVPLVAGSNLVSAECRKAGARVGDPVFQHWLVRLRDAPTARVQLYLGDEGLILDAGASAPAVSRPTPIRSYVWWVGTRDRGAGALPATGPRVTTPAPAEDGEYRVTLAIADESGRTDETAVIFRVSDGKLLARDDVRDSPAWATSAMVYGVMVSAFDPRRLAGVTARLDELLALGVNTLWLSPITASASADFGYAVTDHFTVRDDMGSEADLRALVTAAHARDLRVMLDFVPNHLSDQHPYFVNASRYGRTSPYFDFFARTASGEAEHYFDWGHLKNLNYDNPEVQQMMIEAFAHWVREFDVDGFRVDAAWGPRERAPNFWPRWQRELTRIKPDLLLLAEASARDPYYVRSGFDAAYDWTDQLGAWSWAEAFTDPADIAGRLRKALASRADASMIPVFRFLNNNDTGARFVTRYGAARTRVAAAMLLTLPGIPGLYTGDEVGAEYEPYHQHGAISWEDAHGLRTWYASLLRMRHDVPALRARGLRILDMPNSPQVLGYLRPGKCAGDAVLVLLNYGSEPTDVALPESVLAKPGAEDSLRDLLDGEFLMKADMRAIRLAGYGVRILQPR